MLSEIGQVSSTLFSGTWFFCAGTWFPGAIVGPLALGTLPRLHAPWSVIYSPNLSYTTLGFDAHRG